ncbi:FimB/Mfa2 family fimbrial subunit [Phocaeicola sp.]
MKKTVIHKEYRANRKIKLSVLCKLLIFTAVFQSLSSCVKDDLYNTPHPDKGAVEITTDWTGRSSDAVVPSSYILRIGTQEQTVSKETNVFDALFLPGTQDLLVYNPTEGITIDENVATVNTLPDGTLEPMPGYLFSAARKLEIEKDDTLKVTVPMQQHIRSLTLTLKLKAGDEQRIRSTAATLTGIASAVDLTTGAITATEGKTVIPAFVLGTDDGGMRAAGQTYPAGQTRSTGQPQLSATMRLLGVIAGERQVLTLKITLTTGHIQTVTTDLTEALKNFGSDMKPLELDATLELATEAGFTGTISDWNVVDNGQVDIH